MASMSLSCMLVATTKSNMSVLILNLVIASCLWDILEAGQADCTISSPPAECCEMEPTQPCLIRGMVSHIHQCTIACQRRFMTLGWDCYEAYHMSFQWQIMQSNCDPQNNAVFLPPVTTAGPVSVEVALATDGGKNRIDTGMHAGLIVGAVVGIAVVLAGVIIVCWLCFKRRMDGRIQVIDVSAVRVTRGKDEMDIEAPRSQPQLHQQSLRAVASQPAAFPVDQTSHDKQEHRHNQEAKNVRVTASVPTPARSFRLNPS